MPYIKTIPPSEATGKLKESYESGAGPSLMLPCSGNSVATLENINW